MSLYINPDDQKAVDRMRIDLAQATIDMTEVFTHDVNSQKKKTAVLQQLSEIRKTMDELGIIHTSARKIDNIRSNKAASTC